MMRRFSAWRVRLVVSVILAVASAGAGPAPVKGEWRSYGADNASTKYSPLDQINSANVAKLRVTWRRPQVSHEFLAAHPKLRLSNNFRSTPIMVDGLLYATDAVGVAEAFDPETGRTIWRQPL